MKTHGLLLSLTLAFALTCKVWTETPQATHTPDPCPQAPARWRHEVTKSSLSIVVCQHDPDWSESAWQIGRNHTKRLALHGAIIDAVESYTCPEDRPGTHVHVEIRHTTHQGTRTRSIFTISADDTLQPLAEWQRRSRNYPPPNYRRCQTRKQR